MDGLPSSIILDIFSRVLVKCLARSRCVWKVWCKCINDRYLVIIHEKRLVEEPTPILYHPHLFREKIAHSLCFYVTESKNTARASNNYVLEQKKGPLLEYLCKKRLSNSPRVTIRVQGSCNGLMCLLQDDDEEITSLVVVHPLRKECYELPSLSMRFNKTMLRDPCSLGFDASTNTLKMVRVLCKSNMVSDNPYVMKQAQNGAYIWHKFMAGKPHVLSYPITGKAIFSNSCLHWLVSHPDVPTQDGGRPVIWFDVEKEELGVIDPPKRMCDLWRKYSCAYDHLVDLNGGYVCCRTMEVWVLNKQKEWVLHCQFAKEITPENAFIYVMGCWNKDEDILIDSISNGRILTLQRDDERYLFFVYDLETRVANIAISYLVMDWFLYLIPSVAIHLRCTRGPFI